MLLVQAPIVFLFYVDYGTMQFIFIAIFLVIILTTSKFPRAILIDFMEYSRIEID